MIVAERKPLVQIAEMVEPFQKVLVVGCGTCVAVCLAGGEKEVAVLAEELRLKFGPAGQGKFFGERTLTRQCDVEYLDQLSEIVDEYDAILSMACGAGVQFMAERYDYKPVFPALNTRFIGVALEAGTWSQRCIACSDCILDKTGGICPKTMCSKGLINGPCGGTNHGKCEVSPDRDCAWTLIYRRLEKLGRLDLMRQIQPLKRHFPATRPITIRHDSYKRFDA